MLVFSISKKLLLIFSIFCSIYHQKIQKVDVAISVGRKSVHAQDKAHKAIQCFHNCSFQEFPSS
ncbi:MAG: hypothetical protein U9Q66_00905 [Patescibacteria group bacterium]|nr:hypothetical protein [Patescibacteria group bacterium]